MLFTQRQPGASVCASKLLVCLFAAIAFAAVPARAQSPSSRLGDFSHLAGIGSAVADFNGDKGLDRASAELLSSQQKDFRYRVTLDLTGSANTHFDITTRDDSGVRIAVADVDGDRDYDLVLTTGPGSPLGIWLNDGTGQFSSRSVVFYPVSIWAPQPILVSIPASPSHVPGLIEQRTLFAVCLARSDLATPEASTFRSHETTRILSSSSAGSISSRAPPALS